MIVGLGSFSDKTACSSLCFKVGWEAGQQCSLSAGERERGGGKEGGRNLGITTKKMTLTFVILPFFSYLFLKMKCRYSFTRTHK